MRLRRVAEESRATKPDRIKVFFKRDKWKVLVAGLVTAFLMYVSSVPNVGYSSTVEVDTGSAILYVNDHPCFGYILNGHINAYFNPLTYPISHLTGTGKISWGFVRWSGSTYPAAQDPFSATELVVENITLEVLLNELVKNLPYTICIGGITAFGVGGVIQNIKGKFKKTAPEISSFHRHGM